MNKQENEELSLRTELSELKDTVEELAQAYLENISDKFDDIPGYLHHSEEQMAQSVKAHPLMSVGIAALVGFLLGAVLTRK